MLKRNLRWLRLFRDKVDPRANFLATVNRPWTPKIDPSKCKYCLGFHRHRRPEIFIMYGAALKSRLKIFGSSAVEYFISFSHPHRYLMLMEIGTERKARIKKLCRVRFSESMLGWNVMWRQQMWELPLAGCLNFTRPRCSHSKLIELQKLDVLALEPQKLQSENKATSKH